MPRCLTLQAEAPVALGEETVSFCDQIGDGLDRAYVEMQEMVTDYVHHYEPCSNGCYPQSEQKLRQKG